MKINNKDATKAQCPNCGSWCNLFLENISDHMAHMFICCNRTFIVSINKENLEKLGRREDIEIPDNYWWVYKGDWKMDYWK